jgi:RNA polymerase sigma-70 factor (ECF subfamily)
MDDSENDLNEKRPTRAGDRLMPMDADPTVDPIRFRGPGEPYAGHWREFPTLWQSPEQQTLASEMRLQVADALSRLPDRERVVITLRDVEGCSPAEVCSILNISAREQRLLLHRARAFVRTRLEEYFNARHRTLGPGTDPEPT